MRRARLLLLVAALGPAAAGALEPRYDHRDEAGFLVQPLLAHDTVAVNGHEARSHWRPALRLAYGWDPLGEGNELFLGAQTALSSFEDEGRTKILQAVDARYRAYFGYDEWKTFFELGLWAPLRSRFSVGPLVTIGGAYDFSRRFGLFAEAGFATGLGAARVASFDVSAGAHFRF